MFFWSLFSLPVVAVSALAILGFAGRLWWGFDLFSHFRVQYFVILAVSALVYLLGKQYIASGIAAGLSVINLALVVPLYFRSHTDPANEGNTYRLLVANVLGPNQDYDLIIALIQKEQPDFIVLVEPSQAWLKAMEIIQADYPYSRGEAREDNYGIAFYSRIQADVIEIRSFGEADVPSVVAHLNLSGQPVMIIGTHPPPPKGEQNSRLRNQQLSVLADFIRSQAGQKICCGDMNMTPWSPHFRDLIQKSGLHDSARGFGFQPSWPVDKPLFLIPIDQCLISSGIIVHERAIGPNIGSDHYPIFVKFSL
jgi:endonuclease/exonuclease/phosphatase (EEP) superfamily protein YafD